MIRVVRPALSIAAIAMMFLVTAGGNCPGNTDDGGTTDGGSGDGDGDGDGDNDGGTGDGDGDGDGDFMDPGKLCATDAECPGGFCLNAGGDLLGVGQGYCASTCLNDADCEYGDGNEWGCFNLLGPMGTSACGLTCVNDTCPNPDDRCIEGIQIGTVQTDLCLVMEGLLCDGDADCADGFSCTIGGEPDGSGFYSFCQDDGFGAQAGGESCNANANLNIPCTVATAAADCPTDWTCPMPPPGDPTAQQFCDPPEDNLCRSFICWETDQCASPCAEDADCPTDFKCHGFTFRVGGPTDADEDDIQAQVNLCRPFPGSGDTCTDNGGCPAGEVCQAFRDLNLDYQRACRTAALPGAAAFGERCGDDPSTFDVDEPTKACDSGFCGVDGLCSRFCTADADCGAGYVCLDDAFAVQEGVNDAKVCRKGNLCDTNAECTAPEVCGLVNVGDGFTKVCSPPVGDIASGGMCNADLAFTEDEVCNDDADCAGLAPGGADLECLEASKTCVVPEAESCAIGGCFVVGDEGHCPVLCVDDDDCTEPDFTCTGFVITYDANENFDPADDSTANFGVCSYTPGSLTPCTSNADCPTGTGDGGVVDGGGGGSDPETCQLIRNLADGAVATVCTSATAGYAAEPGQSCGRVGNAVNRCASGVCDFDGDAEEGGIVGVCGDICVDNDDCPGGQSCAELELGPTMTESIMACRTPAATAP